MTPHFEYPAQDRITRLLQEVRPRSRRDLLLFAIMYRFGLRPEEVSLILARHVDLAKSEISIPRLRGGESRSYVLDSSLAAPLSKYLAAHAIPPDRPSFPVTPR